LGDLESAAHAIGVPLHVLWAGTDHEIDAAIESVAQMHIPALLVASDPFFISRSDKLVALAARYAVPAIYEDRDFTVASGLMSYGPDFFDAVRQVGVYTGRILKGEKPTDLPVLQRPSTIWSSISKPPRSLVSMCRRRCLPSQTR
jgi:putative ABC transport system substrate-binding protein